MKEPLYVERYDSKKSLVGFKLEYKVFSISELKYIHNLFNIDIDLDFFIGKAINRVALDFDLSGNLIKVNIYYLVAIETLHGQAQPRMVVEAPRVLRRLQYLREWSHEQIQQVFP